MSIKTLRKRIALVAVSALGAGLMSVVAVPTANAAATVESAHIGYTGSTTGSAAMNNGNPTTSMTSVGLLSYEYATVSGGTVATGTILSTAQISFAASSASALAAVVTGGYISSATSGTDGVGLPTVSSSRASVLSVADAGMGFIAVPTAAVGSTMTVSFYKGGSVAALTPTNGTLIGQYVLTVASASVSGIPSPADSTCSIAPSNAKGTAADGGTTYDDNSLVSNGRVGLVYVDLEDAYGNQVAGGTLTASATGDVYVNIGTESSDQYSAAYAFDSTAIAHETYVNVVQKTANSPATGVITISYMGSVVCQKTIKFGGDADSIAVDEASSFNIFKVGATGLAPAAALEGVYYVVKDSAGNTIDWTTDPTITGTGSMAAAQIDTTYATSSTSMDDVEGYGTVTVTIPSTTTLTGAGTYQLQITNARGTVLKTQVVKATVSGAVYSFEASWDKASYAPGEIAVLTITAKDSKGNSAADGDLGGTSAAVTVNSDGLGSLTTTCDTLSTKVYVGGKMTCKFAVKNTPGSYSYSVYVANTSVQAATVGTVKIAAATTTVTNAEVLAAIVKLIASINKQIKALQKSLRR